MISLQLGGGRPIRSVLLLGAHCDDIEIGCGGTVLQLAKQFPDAEYTWVTLSSDAERAAETRAAADQLLEGARRKTMHVETFRTSYFPCVQASIKDFFEHLKDRVTPDLILTHCRNDLHQDHRVTNELTWNTFRDHLILEYEVPKFDGDLGTPNVFVPLTRQQLEQKSRIVIENFPSQRSRAWFNRETFEAIARLRGIECNAPDGYAEGFYGRKIRLFT